MTLNIPFPGWRLGEPLSDARDGADRAPVRREGGVAGLAEGAGGAQERQGHASQGVRGAQE